MHNPIKTLQQVLFIAAVALIANFAAADSDYHIGAGDVIRVNVFGYPDLASEARVSQSGNITFPLIGEVKVGDLTTSDAEVLIAHRLVDGNFIRQPHVTVQIAQFQSQMVAVMGQVNKPGQYPLEKASHVIDMLAAAGGVATATGGDDAMLLRKSGARVPIDLQALFEGDPTQNVAVNGGDTLYVPRAAQFYIYGEVQKPGVYRLERNMTVSQAITAGSGLTSRGTERHPVIKRRNAGGKEQEITADGSTVLQPDDVIYIQESLF